MASHVKGKIFSTAIGMYEPGEKRLLAPAFVNSVNAYLHRYAPKLVSREDAHVRMQVDYDWLFDVELTVKADSYEITITLAEEPLSNTSHATARKDAAKLAPALLRRMEDELMRSGRGRNPVPN